MDSIESKINTLQQSIKELRPGCEKSTIDKLLDEVAKCEWLIRLVSDSVLKAVLQDKLLFMRDALMTIGQFAQQSSDDQIIKLDPSMLKMGPEIGRGSYAVVYKAQLDGTPVAAKIIKNAHESVIKAVMSEANTMNKIRQPNMVRYMGAFSTGTGEVVIVSEFCDGDLKHLGPMRSDPNFLSNAVKWFCQAARGLAYMHDVLHMVHQDIKPANILLKNGEAQIADFGFTVSADELLKDERKGTPYFMAPELWIAGKEYGYPIDVYALAITMYSVLTDNKLYPGVTSPEALRNMVLTGQRPDFSLVKMEIPASLRFLIEKCWAGDASARPKMREVYEALKSIFLETIIPSNSLAFRFWITNFGDELIDKVSAEKLLNALPGGANPVTRRQRMLLLRLEDVNSMVSLKTIDDMVNWYGNWFDESTLNGICGILESNPWFVGLMDQKEAENRINNQWMRTREPCFLIRCSKTNSKLYPYTITMLDTTTGTICNHRVSRAADGCLYCLSLGNRGDLPVNEKDIFLLMTKLAQKGVIPPKPYVPIYVSESY